MANTWGSRIARGFGFGDVKDQPDYQGEKPVRLSSTPWGQKSWSSIEDALARKGTGYSKDVFDVNKAAWANQARDYLTNVATPQITSQASARGLGRSSLVPAQIARAGTEQSLDLAQKSAELQRQSEMAEINQQMQGRGLGANMAQSDVASQGAVANFQKNIFDQQQAYKQSEEALMQQNAMKIPAMIMSFGDSFMQKFTGANPNTAGISMGNAGSSVQKGESGLGMNDISRLLGGMGGGGSVGGMGGGYTSGGLMSMANQRLAKY